MLDAYAAHVPGFFLYYPSRAQRSPALRLFVETARELASTRIIPSGSSPSVGG